jgi:hypothetical protein
VKHNLCSFFTHTRSREKKKRNREEYTTPHHSRSRRLDHAIPFHRLFTRDLFFVYFFFFVFQVRFTQRVSLCKLSWLGLLPRTGFLLTVPLAAACCCCTGLGPGLFEPIGLGPVSELPRRAPRTSTMRAEASFGVTSGVICCVSVSFGHTLSFWRRTYTSAVRLQRVAHFLDRLQQVAGTKWR